MEEFAVIKAIVDNPYITQEALKKAIDRSISTVKRLTVNLRKKGILIRKNGKRDGYWQVQWPTDGHEGIVQINDKPTERTE